MKNITKSDTTKKLDNLQVQIDNSTDNMAIWELQKKQIKILEDQKKLNV